MKNSAYTFLMYNGKAEEALDFYMAIFKDSKIKSIQRYEFDNIDLCGKIKKAIFNIKGNNFICSDSPVKHNFNFTLSISIYVEFDDDNELENVYKNLNENGKILMELGTYEFSRKYAWIEDKFGVSWQLNCR